MWLRCASVNFVLKLPLQKPGGVKEDAGTEVGGEGAGELGKTGVEEGDCSSPDPSELHTKGPKTCGCGLGTFAYPIGVANEEEGVGTGVTAGE